jgi:hypothetical protein
MHRIPHTSLPGLKMKFLDDVSLPGHRTISGAFRDRAQRMLAVASSFRLLTEPRARASYGGHRLRHRLAVYRPPATSPLAVFDAAAFPINDVAFHPSEPIVAIGAGSYDGGFFFEGQLVLWDWESGKCISTTTRVPEVLRLRFSDDGSALNLIVRPWDEDSIAGKADPFELVFKLTLSVASMSPAAINEQEVAAKIEGQKPLSLSEIAADSKFFVSAEPVREIENAFRFSNLRSRSPIWDVALIGSNAIAVVHDECLLELRSAGDSPLCSFKGEGHGVQILPGTTPLIHVSHFNWRASSSFKATRTELMALNRAELSTVAELEGAYTFSVSRDGLVLGRLNRSFASDDPKRDVIINSRSGLVVRHDLGHYDVFNHYLRIDGAPYLFCVQGTPPNSHERKHLCIVAATGEIRRLWPILGDNADQASHAMECCFGYVNDSEGEGVIVAGRHYNSSPATPCRGFIYRKNLQDGKELWRHPTSASVTTIKGVPQTNIVLAAFLDGGLAVFASDSGTIFSWEEFKPDGLSNIIFSLDANASHLSIGLIDGRYGLLRLSELVPNKSSPTI